MKRFVAIWLTVALLCLLFGCVSHDPKTDGDGTTTSTKATTTAPTNNPQVGLKFEQEYVGTYRESADLLQTTTIRFDPNEKGSCILTDYWYYSEEIFPNLSPFEHEGKTWYTGGSGEQKYFCELTDGQVVIKGRQDGTTPNEITVSLVLQRDGTLRVTGTAPDFAERFPTDSLLKIAE